jgi:hypothetical protein
MATLSASASITFGTLASASAAFGTLTSASAFGTLTSASAAPELAASLALVASLFAAGVLLPLLLLLALI